ncbi:hypothetical protein TrispH2_004350 [Trichoplax sp. H2]|nr:hypothetical protein TrispH2_004350 [Trichoplax sp. H2]|eukprot:RDD44475.1 hypothetical protein TrispH2_004350 [Trichoplax sp. H2]
MLFTITFSLLAEDEQNFETPITLVNTWNVHPRSNDDSIFFPWQGYSDRKGLLKNGHVVCYTDRKFDQSDTLCYLCGSGGADSIIQCSSCCQTFHAFCLSDKVRDVNQCYLNVQNVASIITLLALELIIKENLPKMAHGFVDTAYAALVVALLVLERRKVSGCIILLYANCAVSLETEANIVKCVTLLFYLFQTVNQYEVLMNLPDDYQFTCDQCTKKSAPSWKGIADEHLHKLILQVGTSNSITITLANLY